ncbi:RNA polymerase sigma factor [Dinghuibacter silviterrae]|uniref:RNA polymerase sigma-70 factor (ECF subfamily) n=1 Tax=Dinghuibacter silviterrae TaxID=1539049 RepID=A0A4R8DHT5_9BACT|nr:sigma-70 family RNA polymerase sigma factor [Dinghuibacter silviterrae]TDW97028.1 RNA polymerase sigma-70 factor (ECF subfamily) [Dinghuibacter silviterrae]
MSDESTKDPWVRRLQSDDNEAFKEIYRQYHSAVFANIRRLVHPETVAEDLLQEVFLLLWEQRHQLKPEHTVAGWLFTTSFYKASAHLRKAVKENLQPLPDSIQDVPDEGWDAGQEVRLSVMHTAIDLLPPRKKMAFRLCRLEGKTYQEAADELGLTTASVKDYVKTASQFVKQYVLAQSPALMGLCVLEAALYFQG